MRSVKQNSLELTDSADAVFQAALGVVQNTKNMKILAVHTGGRRLIVREKPKMSNAKFMEILVEDRGQGSQLAIAVGTDPRNPKALLDGRANEKSLKGYLEKVRGALDGSAPAQATPVSDHYLQKKTEVPWSDPAQNPEIELDGNVQAAYGL